MMEQAETAKSQLKSLKAELLGERDSDAASWDHRRGERESSSSTCPVGRRGG